MLIQGSNNPIVIKFDRQIEDIPALVVSLWRDSAHYPEPICTWHRQDMLISGDTVVCDLTTEVTRDLPNCILRIEAKGLDDDGNTIFWDRVPVDVKVRKDRDLQP